MSRPGVRKFDAPPAGVALHSEIAKTADSRSRGVNRPGRRCCPTNCSRRHPAAGCPAFFGPPDAAWPDRYGLATRWHSYTKAAAGVCAGCITAVLTRATLVCAFGGPKRGSAGHGAFIERACRAKHPLALCAGGAAQHRAASQRRTLRATGRPGDFAGGVKFCCAVGLPPPACVPGPLTKHPRHACAAVARMPLAARTIAKKYCS